MKWGTLSICCGICLVPSPFQLRKHRWLGQDELRSCLCFLLPVPEAGLTQPSSGVETQTGTGSVRSGTTATGQGRGRGVNVHITEARGSTPH